MKRRNLVLPRKHPLEWLVFAASLGLVVFVLGYLLYSANRMTESLPSLEVEMGDSFIQFSNEPNQFAVPVIVRNRGGQTALEVAVEISLYRGDSEEAVETTQMTVPMIPFHSERRGLVAFVEDPSEGRLVARVLGFIYP